LLQKPGTAGHGIINEQIHLLVTRVTNHEQLKVINFHVQNSCGGDA
jgi:hypothetical protein